LSESGLARIWHQALTWCFHRFMRFGLLGPVEFRPDETARPAGGLKQRTLLAVFLLQANKPVSRERMISALWGDTPPPSVNAALDAYLYRLRRLVAVLPTGRSPLQLALDPGARTLYVADFSSAAVTVLSLARCTASVTAGCGTAARQVAVGSLPAAVAVNPSTCTVYVANVLAGLTSVFAARSS
jgi:hypothetical protein